jgi:hypothetical protein
MLRPSDKDYVLVRNINDGGDPYKDQFELWAISK